MYGGKAIKNKILNQHATQSEYDEMNRQTKNKITRPDDQRDAFLLGRILSIGYT